MQYIDAILGHVGPIISEASKSQFGLMSLVAVIVLAIVLLFLCLTARTRPVLSFALALVVILLMFGGVVGLVLSVDVRKAADYEPPSLGDKLRGLPAKYNRPDTLFLGTSSPVELVIQTGGEQTIDEMLKGFPGEVRTTTVRMANRASAYLTGPKDMVEITPRGDPLRTVTTDAPVSWIWDVRPLKPGRAQVVLEVFSQVKGGADEPRAQVRVLQDTWTIEAKGLEWVKYQIADIEPIRAFLFTLISAVVATLAYFGIKGSKTSKPSRDNT